MPDSPQPPAADPSVYVGNIQGAIQAFKDAGKPADQLPALRQVIQANYGKLQPTGYFEQGDGQQLGHQLRAQGYVSDPSQGASLHGADGRYYTKAQVAANPAGFRLQATDPLPPQAAAPGPLQSMEAGLRSASDYVLGTGDHRGIIGRAYQSSPLAPAVGNIGHFLAGGLDMAKGDRAGAAAEYRQAVGDGAKVGDQIVQAARDPAHTLFPAPILKAGLGVDQVLAGQGAQGRQTLGAAAHQAGREFRRNPLGVGLGYAGLVAPMLGHGIGKAAEASSAAELHPTAPGVNGAARAIDGKFTPAPEVSAPKVATQEVPHAPTPSRTPPPARPLPAPPAAPVAAPVPADAAAVPAGGPQVAEPSPAQPANPYATATPAIPHPDDVAAAALARMQARKKVAPPPSDPRLVPNFPLSELHTDPERFQYKIGSGQGGQTGSLSGAPAFNQELAGVVHVWRDPADGKAYVVNGHNRYALAQRTGQTGLDVRFLDAKDAADARTKGAMINIAEGQGTAIDAAKLFREQGMTPESVAGKGISLKGQKAAQGLALSNLSPSLFGQVVRGELPIERGALIGEKLPNIADQQTLVTMLDKVSAKGKAPTNDVVSELADQIRNGPKNTETSASLFGDDTTTRSTALERAEVAAFIKGQLGKEGAVFGGAAKNADRLAKGNNVIDAETSAKIAQNSRQGVEIFDRMKNASGPVSDILNAAASRLAKGENANAVKSDALKQFQDAVPGLAQGRPDTGTGEGLPTGTGDGGTGGQPQPGPDLFGGEPSLSDKLDQAANAAAARIAARNKGRASSGVDPEDLADMAIWGAARLAKGVVGVGDWSRHMVETFGESVRPHLQDLYAEAKAQHAQIFGRPAPEASPTTAEASPTTAEASPTTSNQGSPAPQTGETAPQTATAPKNAPAEYAGSINLDRMGVSDEAKQVIREATDRLHQADPDGPPTLSHADALAAANALNLTPDMAKQIPVGESPSGVHPGIYSLALRNLVAKQAEALRTIPADDPARPALQAESDDTIARASALSRASGQHLSLHNAIASPVEEAVQAAQARQQALAQAAALPLPRVDNPALSVTTKPGRAGYGEKNVVVKKGDADAALARIRQAAGRVHSGVDPMLLKDFAVWGAYHIEAGLRKFADFAGEIDRQFPGHTLPQKQQIYAASRAEYASGFQNRLKQTGQMIFADALAGRLGRQGASDYINALADGPHPDLLQKLLAGDPSKLTPAEKQFANDTLRAHAPAKGKGVSQQSLAAVNAISKEFADANRRAALQKARAGRQKARAGRQKARAGRQAGKPLPDPLTRTLLGRVGRVNAPEFIRRLNADPDTAGVVGKLQAGQALTDAEKRAVAGHLDALKAVKTPASPSDVSKELTQIARDAKAGKLGFDSAKAVVQHELTQNAEPGQIGAANAELAGVAPGDTAALARIHAKYSPSSAADKILFAYRSNLLSGPNTLKSILASHLLGATVEDTATRAAAALIDPVMAKLLNDASGKSVEGFSPKATGQAALAGVKAIPEGLRLLRHGEAAMQLEGMAPSFQYQEGHRGLQVEPINGVKHGPVGAVVSFFPRTHGAVFHVIGKALFERGRIEAANLKANQLGGDPMQYRADPDVLQQAALYRKEQLYQGGNKAADGLAALGRHSGPVGRVIAGGLMPFNRVPMNLAMRGLEYTGAGAPLAAARAAGVRLTGRDFASGKKVEASELSAFRRNVSMQAARGVVGGTAGLALGYGLAKKGVLTPPNAKEHEYGRVNAGRYSFDTSRLQPVMAAPNLGANVEQARNHQPADFASQFLDNPYFSAAEKLGALTDPKSGGIERFAGQQIAGAIPLSSLLGQIASTTDPSGQTRKQRALIDYIANKVPFAREKLPPTGRPQTSNVKAVGAPLALLSPVGVEPRRPAPSGGGGGRGNPYGRLSSGVPGVSLRFKP